jgi:HD domain
VTAPDHLRNALSEPGHPRLRPRPGEVAQLLQDLEAPPRLAAHLRAVHDVACQINDWLTSQCPDLRFDLDAVLFGAATHDIGKTVYTAELSGPGSEHEEAGRQLLLAHGVSPGLARFAATHAHGRTRESRSKTCWSASLTRSGRTSAYTTSKTS